MDEMIYVNTAACPICGATAPPIEMPVRDYITWMDHTPLEIAWPEGTSEQHRQALTGTCPHHEGSKA